MKANERKHELTPEEKEASRVFRAYRALRRNAEAQEDGLISSENVSRKFALPKATIYKIAGNAGVPTTLIDFRRFYKAGAIEEAVKAALQPNGYLAAVAETNRRKNCERTLKRRAEEVEQLREQGFVKPITLAESYGIPSINVSYILKNSGVQPVRMRTREFQYVWPAAEAEAALKAYVDLLKTDPEEARSLLRREGRHGTGGRRGPRTPKRHAGDTAANALLSALGIGGGK